MNQISIQKTMIMQKSQIKKSTKKTCLTSNHLMSNLIYLRIEKVLILRKKKVPVAQMMKMKAMIAMVLMIKMTMMKVQVTLKKITKMRQRHLMMKFILKKANLQEAKVPQKNNLVVQSINMSKMEDV